MSAKAKAKDKDVVQPWMLVEVEMAYEQGVERLKFVIVPDELADFNAGFLGEGTPLARSILGERVGVQVPYFIGDARTVQILRVSPTELKPDEDTAVRRQEKIKRAVEDSERTSVMIFASSFSGKWGDYDPQGIESWEQKEDGTTDRS